MSSRAQDITVKFKNNDSGRKLASLIRSKILQKDRCPRCWADVQTIAINSEKECPICEDYGIVDPVPYCEMIK